MFEKEQTRIQDQIETILKEEDIPAIPLRWTWIPFSGHWGIATSFFAHAAADPEKSKGFNVKKKAVEIAKLKTPMSYNSLMNEIRNFNRGRPYMGKEDLLYDLYAMKEISKKVFLK